MLLLFRLWMGVLSVLSYKLLFWSDRDVTIAAVLLAIVCAFATGVLLAPDGEEGLWLAEARGVWAVAWSSVAKHLFSGFEGKDQAGFEGKDAGFEGKDQ